MSKGFTLVELLLVIAILAIIAYFSITYFGGYESKTSLDSATSEISSYLQQARSKSMAQEKGKAWGVKFDSDEKGHFYQIQSSDEVYSETKRYLPAGITFKDFTPPQKIQFTKLYGSRSDVSTISTIELVSFKLGTSKSVNVNEEGRIYVGHIEEEEAISCTLPEECESGFCVDGYCCNSACEGTCEACNLAGNLGTCTTRPADDNTECGTCERCDGINTFCQYVSSGQQGKNCTTICYACDDLGFCVAQTVDYAAATALGCTLGAEACRKCTAGTCGYYTSGQHGCSAGQQCNASGECETSYECIKGADCPADKYCQESTHSCQTTPVCQLKVADGYGTTNVTDNTQATGCNGTCQACQSGSCGNATADTDPGNHCGSYMCVNWLYGWANSSCKRYLESTSHNGLCKTGGVCYTLEESCQGQGETTITCGSSGCKKACPQNGAVVDYDEMNEVCYTSGQHQCPEGYECDATGTCVAVEPNCDTQDGCTICISVSMPTPTSTKIDPFTAPASAYIGDTITLSAKLTYLDGTPIANETIYFEDTTDSVTLCSGTTNLSGIAENTNCYLPLTLTGGLHTLKAKFLGNRFEQTLPSDKTASLQVNLYDGRDTQDGCTICISVSTQTTPP